MSQYHPGNWYVGASPRPDGKVQQNGGASDALAIISIPTNQTEEFNHTITAKMQPLWAMRVVVRVDGGFGIEFGDWRIRIGEVRQTAGGGGQTRVRGCVVEITLISGDDEEDDISAEDRETLFGGLWEQLDLEGGRPFVNVPGVGGEDKGLDLIRQYMDLLRFTRS